MEMKKVKSSNVAAVGHVDSSSTLQVSFNNGSTYQYFNVPVNVFLELYNASSVGGYLAKKIKGKYKYKQV
ncbi:MAG: hypothetical protein ACI8VC_001723 [Candidatus Endobugula sp.]|jgi:hypothetical protein